MTDSNLALTEVDILPRVAKRTFPTMAEAGQIPAFKGRSQGPLNQNDIDRRIDAHKPMVKGHTAKGACNV